MRLNYIQSPCKDCKKRHLKCHSTCEAYLDFRKRFQAERERLYLEDKTDKIIKQLNYDSTKKREPVSPPLKHGRGKK